MERAASGDVEAFAEIYDRHAGVLLALAQRMVPSADALDLLHDVFLEAWRVVRSYDPSRAEPRTWLIVRLRSRALDRRARAARFQRASRALATHPELSTGNTRPSFGSLHSADRDLDVGNALRGIEDDVRAVLALTYFEGLTAEEISMREDIPVGTVRSRLARGLSQLKRALGARKGGSDG
jgi:RNA polymerase sigma-70 factor (ECF subfamily)